MAGIDVHRSLGLLKVRITIYSVENMVAQPLNRPSCNHITISNPIWIVERCVRPT